MSGIYHAPNPDNVKASTFAPGSEERALLKAALEEVSNQKIVIPAIINGQEIYTDDRFEVRARTTTVWCWRSAAASAKGN